MSNKQNDVYNETIQELIADGEYAAAWYEIQRQAACDHRCERNYYEDGNMGGFAAFITECSNCGKRLTENDD